MLLQYFFPLQVVLKGSLYFVDGLHLNFQSDPLVLLQGGTSRVVVNELFGVFLFMGQYFKIGHGHNFGGRMKHFLHIPN